MLLLTVFSKFNQWVGPRMVETALSVRSSALGAAATGGGEGAISATTTTAVTSTSSLSLSFLDALLLHPFTKLISIEAHHQYRDDDQVKTCVEAGDLKGASNRRVEILQKHYVTPSMLAKHWDAWRTHERFQKWLRSEFLLAMHGPTIQKSFHHLRNSPQFESKRSRPLLGWNREGNKGDSNAASTSSSDAAGRLVSKLPTTEKLERWLHMKDWTDQKDTDANTTAMRSVATKVGGSIQVRHGGALCVAVVPNRGGTNVSNDDSRPPPTTASLSDLTLEELIELSGGHVSECGPMNAVCEHYNLYQIYTKEYVQKLGEYLRTRPLQIDPPSDASSWSRDVIVDVGAGDGVLAQLLNDYFASCATTSDKGNRRTASPSTIVSFPRTVRRHGGRIAAAGKHHRNSPRSKRRAASTASRSEEESNSDSQRALHGPWVVATDDGSWRIRPRAPVERLSVEQALDKYCPPNDDTAATPARTRGRVTVICSWMPMGVDWTSMFRQYRVDEYLLVGECDDGQCGHNWETWGNPHFGPPSAERGEAYDDDQQELLEAEETRKSNALTAPYLADGYERHDLDFLAPHQFSRYDSRVSKSGRTVSFRLRQRRS